MEEMDDVDGAVKAGSIKRISVENFMCHSSLTIELGGRVNFITGQNGSGKSAILTALCVAFGIKARGTQRANSMKDFIKNGCRYGSVLVELNNEGEDAFKPDLFGDTIFVERRITDSTSTFLLKDSQGRKVGTKRTDVLEVVEHFNIEVENPCVIMTQDKSREFLHGGSDKEKFKFYFKATLLQQLSERLSECEQEADQLLHILNEDMSSLEPTKNELKRIEDQLKTLEHVEGLRLEVEKLEKIYAWSYVKVTEAALREAEERLRDFKDRIPKCQAKIDDCKAKEEALRMAQAEKQALILKMMNDTQELKHSQDQLQMALTEAMKEKVQSEEDLKRVRRSLKDAKDRLDRIEHNAAEMHQKMFQDTQAEVNEKLEEIQSLELAKQMADEDCRKLQEQEGLLRSECEEFAQHKAAIMREIDAKKGELRDERANIQQYKSRQGNKVVTFGGESVLRLLRAIEENQARFTRPPLGPIGAHLGLVDDDWSLAVEVAVGRILNNFVVTNQRDTLLLRDLGNRVGCHYLGIITANFDRPPIRPTANDLPDGSLLTVLGSLQCENSIIMNVLIDQVSVDNLVLVEDYDTGKNVAFNGSYRNVKEVITKDGTRMYSRAGAETTLFKDRRTTSGRLGVSVDEQILQAEARERDLNTSIMEAEGRKRKIDNDMLRCSEKADNLKRRRTEVARTITRHGFRIRDLQNAMSNEAEMNKESSLIELETEIVQAREEIQSKEESLQKTEFKLQEALRRCNDAKSLVDQFYESARGDFESLQAAEEDLVTLGGQLHEATKESERYQQIMEQKVIANIKSQEQITEDILNDVEKHRSIAAEICPEEERQALGEDSRTREQLSSQITRLRDRVKRQESDNEPLEHLIKKGNKMKRKLSSKEKWISLLQQKHELIHVRLERRKKKYHNNCMYLRRELKWGFNVHLAKKGFSGKVTIDYPNRTLNMSVQMAEDATNTSVRDTRALSGGERSFSTLAFALAVHSMTEAPFRAMDEFDVFMDAVSRKISLDTVVDFALQEGSQWIFITPHDISMVPGSAHVKKQQMPAPRP